jgi:hypothetical protein
MTFMWSCSEIYAGRDPSIYPTAKSSGYSARPIGGLPSYESSGHRRNRRLRQPGPRSPRLYHHRLKRRSRRRPLRCRRQSPAISLCFAVSPPPGERAAGDSAGQLEHTGAGRIRRRARICIGPAQPAVHREEALRLLWMRVTWRIEPGILEKMTCLSRGYLPTFLGKRVSIGEAVRGQRFASGNRNDQELFTEKSGATRNPDRAKPEEEKVSIGLRFSM